MSLGDFHNTLKDALEELSADGRGCLTNELGDSMFGGKPITMDLVLKDPSVKE